MTREQEDRMVLGWTPEHLARVSFVDIAAVYLLERLGSAGPDDDCRIREALKRGKAERSMGET